MRCTWSVAAAMAAAMPALAWNVELPPCLDKFKPFVKSGCFQDGDQSPALVYRSSLDQGSMTVEKCVAECKGNGFRYAGLKYYGVCFCGATVNGPQVDDSKCSFGCSGNKTETCGGDSTLSIWQDPSFAKGPNDVNLDAYKSLGCFTDQSAKGRTLSWPAAVDAATLTTSKCLAACEKQGFPFAGTEYGGECWCGVVLANDTAKVGDAECNIGCRGDGKATCGGASRLNLYVAKELESLEPCGFQAPPTTTVAATTKGPYPYPPYSIPLPSSASLPVSQPSSVSYSPSQSTPASSATGPVSQPSSVSYPYSQPSSASLPVSQPSSVSYSPSQSTPASSASLPVSQPSSVSYSPSQSTPASSASLPVSQPSSVSYSPSQSTPASSASLPVSQPSSASLPVSLPSSVSYSVSKSTLASSASLPISQPSSVSYPVSQPSSASSPAYQPSSASYSVSKSTPASSASSPASQPSSASYSVSKSTPASSASLPVSQPSSVSYPVSQPSSASLPVSQPSSASLPVSQPSSASAPASQPSSSSYPAHQPSSVSAPVSQPSSASLPIPQSSSYSISVPASSSASPTKASSTTPHSSLSSSAALCTSTTTVPAPCEWQIGNWCAPALPDWSNQDECIVAAKTCALQVASCFRYAGWPSSVDCFNFGRWCGNVQQYCYSSECSGDYGRRCSGKKTCWDRYAPGYGNPPAVSTSVHPCSTTASSTRAAATPTPPSRCPRLPTNICKQPSNEALGYGPASPVGNIPLPIVGCSDLRDDYNSRPFKYYSEPDSSNSPSFAWPQWPNVCADACSEQYDQCRATYVQSCRRYSATKRSLSRRIVRQSQQVSKRGAVSLWSGIGSLFGGGVCAPTTDDYSWNNPGADAVNCWGWGGNTPDQAERRCRTQYTDCLEVNKGVSPGGMCQSYCSN